MSNSICPYVQTLWRDLNPTTMKCANHNTMGHHYGCCHPCFYSEMVEENNSIAGPSALTIRKYKKRENTHPFSLQKMLPQLRKYTEGNITLI